MKSALISLGTHISQSPRAQRVASILSESGLFKVTILYPLINSSFLEFDQTFADQYGLSLLHFCNLTQPSFSEKLERIKFKAGRLLCRYLGIDTKYSLFYAAGNALRMARGFKPDLHYGFNEIGCYLSSQLLSIFKVAADFEDYYSKDLLPSANAERPLKLLEEVESTLLLNAPFCTTASHHLASAFSTRYHSNPPFVIYNMFSSIVNSADTDIHELPVPSKAAINLVWFSKTVGPGRGLEEACYAISSVHFDRPLHFYIIGQCSQLFQDRLIHCLSPSPDQKSNQLIFIPALTPDMLMSYLRFFDIGLALERSSPLSRSLTVTYKFFQYISSGLAILATPTLGQQEVLNLCSDSVIYSNGFDAHSLAEALMSFGQVNISSMKEASHRYAATTCARSTYDSQILERIESLG